MRDEVREIIRDLNSKIKDLSREDIRGTITLLREWLDLLEAAVNAGQLGGGERARSSDKRGSDG